MVHQLRAAALMLLALTVLTGLAYPLLITAVAQILFLHQANGSLMTRGNQLLGSELIGQNFTQPDYFWGRLSATGPVPYNAAASSGSNFGPLNPALKAAADQRLQALQAGGPLKAKVPIDLVTASASGLDPHISPAAAEFQIPRVAAARKIAEQEVRDLVQQSTERRQIGVLGEPRVNVLRLNLALDRATAKEPIQ